MLSARAILSFRAANLMLLFGLAAYFDVGAVAAQSKAPDSPIYNVPVFVSNFELYSVAMQPRQGTSPAAPSGEQKPRPPLVYNDTDVPSVQARRLTDFFATTLVQALQARGFRAARASEKNAPNGALIRGVFAEPDALNRVRRALLGSSSPNSRFLLYVGVFNLSRQEQPLYQEGPAQSSSSQYGPIITLNNYIPLTKYELDKNPTEEEVQKICNQIAASLLTLLESNPNAFSK